MQLVKRYQLADAFSELDTSGKRDVLNNPLLFFQDINAVIDQEFVALG